MHDILYTVLYNVYIVHYCRTYIRTVLCARERRRASAQPPVRAFWREREGEGGVLQVQTCKFLKKIQLYCTNIRKKVKIVFKE